MSSLASLDENPRRDGPGGSVSNTPHVSVVRTNGCGAGTGGPGCPAHPTYCDVPTRKSAAAGDAISPMAQRTQTPPRRPGKPPLIERVFNSWQRHRQGRTRPSACGTAPRQGHEPTPEHDGCCSPLNRGYEVSGPGRSDTVCNEHQILVARRMRTRLWIGRPKVNIQLAVVARGAASCTAAGFRTATRRCAAWRVPVKARSWRAKED